MTDENKAGSSTSIFYATGRRKSSVARVWLELGGQKRLVNDSEFVKYFPLETLRMLIDQPFETTQMGDRFGVKATVNGGGLSGQAGAVRLGIARALVLFDANLRSPLRRGGFLTRDPRKKERKKYGRKGARRSFQFTKR